MAGAEQSHQHLGVHFQGVTRAPGTPPFSGVPSPHLSFLSNLCLLFLWQRNGDSLPLCRNALPEKMGWSWVTGKAEKPYILHKDPPPTQTHRFCSAKGGVFCIDVRGCQSAANQLGQGYLFMKSAPCLGQSAGRHEGQWGLRCFQRECPSGLAPGRQRRAQCRLLFSLQRSEQF